MLTENEFFKKKEKEIREKLKGKDYCNREVNKYFIYNLSDDYSKYKEHCLKMKNNINNF